MIALKPLKVQPNLTLVEKPIGIVDTKEKILRRQVIKYVKVQWTNQMYQEATWELEKEMKAKYLDLFNDLGNF